MEAVISPHITVKCLQKVLACVRLGVSVCTSPRVHVWDPSFREREARSLGAHPRAFPPSRLKLSSKRNRLVRELEEATRQVAALHSQLKR